MGAVFWNLVVSLGRSRPVNGADHFALNVKNTYAKNKEAVCCGEVLSCRVKLHIALCHQSQKITLRCVFKLVTSRNLLCADWKSLVYLRFREIYNFPSSFFLDLT